MIQWLVLSAQAGRAADWGVEKVEMVELHGYSRRGRHAAVPLMPEILDMQAHAQVVPALESSQLRGLPVGGLQYFPGTFCDFSSLINKNFNMST